MELRNGTMHQWDRSVLQYTLGFCVGVKVVFCLGLNQSRPQKGI